MDVGMRVVSDAEQGGGLLAADLDDDGLPELLSSMDDAPSTDLVDEGLVQVLPGFEIPFDDPTRW
jgi:hypothetical protein